MPDTELTNKTVTVDKPFRPCHGCHRHYVDCACSRHRSLVIHRIVCPYCWTEFKITTPKSERWIQRCSNCWRAFNAIVEQ